MEGRLRDIDLKSFLYMLHLEGMSCEVSAYTGDGVGTIFFDAGHPADAEHGGTMGSDALFGILRLDNVDIEVRELGRKVERVNPHSLDVLLLELARRHDEEMAGRTRDGSDAAGHRDEWSPARVGAPEDATTTRSGAGEEPMLNGHKLQEVTNYLGEELGEGLRSFDIYSSEDGQSYSGINTNAKACAVFARITASIAKALSMSELPPVEGYYMLNLAGSTSVFCIPGSGYEVGIAVDTRKVKIGMVSNIVIPRVLEILSA